MIVPIPRGTTPPGGVAARPSASRKTGLWEWQRDSVLIARPQDLQLNPANVEPARFRAPKAARLMAAQR